VGDEDVRDPGESGDPNDWWIERFFGAIDQLIERGMDKAEAPRRALQAFTETIANVAPEHAEAIEATGREYLDESAQYRAGFVERLRVHWGDALDLYELIVSVVEDGATKFAERNLASNGSYTLLLDVLAQLTGQAIRVAREVHALLTAGFPLGAHALARTVHEVSVRADVLRAFGASDEHADLAERFVLHDQVINYRDAVVYQRDAERLNYELISDDDMAEMKQAHDDLIARFGPSYGAPYGWAAGLPGLPRPTRPTFEDLETLAQLDHYRGFYRWSSHFIHSDSKALRLSQVERGGSSAVLANATNTMLADPAQQTLSALTRTFTSMVTAGQPFAFYDMLLCESLQILVTKAHNMLVDSENAVDEAEERLQSEYRLKGQTLTLFGSVESAERGV